MSSQVLVNFYGSIVLPLAGLALILEHFHWNCVDVHLSGKASVCKKNFFKKN